MQINGNQWTGFYMIGTSVMKELIDQGFGFVLKHTPSHVAGQHKKARSILIFATLIEKTRDDLLNNS